MEGGSVRGGREGEEEGSERGSMKGGVCKNAKPWFTSAGS